MNNITRLFALFTLCYSAGCTTKATEKESPAEYSVTSPILIDTSIQQQYVSQIQSVCNTEIRAQEKGYLQAVYVDEGQSVKAGQLLFKIMPTLYQAEYLKAEAAVKEAQLDLLNTQTLAEKDIVSKTEQSIKEAKLDEAKADLALAKLHLSLTEIRAPFDGTIDRIPLKLGSLIDEGALMTSLSDNKNVYAYFNVPETEYLDYKAAAAGSHPTEATLLLANNQPHKYKGRIQTVESEFDNSTGNIAFRAIFPNPDLLLKHGETGTVQLTMPLSHALIIPQKATYEIQDKIYVYVLDKNNTVKARNITVKATLPDLYAVGSGLSATDKILLDAVQTVREGDKVSAKYIAPQSVLASLQLIRP